MNTGDIYDDFAIERLAKDQFGVQIDIDKVIVRDIDVGHSARATVFLTTKKQLYCYVYGPTKLLLSDVKKIAVRMGVKVEIFFPPKGRPHYFDEIGKEKFREVFPGRSAASDEDIIFYRTLASYNPALLLVSEVKDGIIYQADTDARGGWRQAVKFAYRRIKTS
jgi:hypothetical protein